MIGLENKELTALIAELNLEPADVSDEDLARAARDINAKMEVFAMEHRRYMQQSRELASHAYFSF